MDKMSEEEIISLLQWVITNKLYIDTHNECDYHKIHEAIETILDLYQKQKEKDLDYILNCYATIEDYKEFIEED